MIFTITTTHTARTVASLEYIPQLDGWICEPPWCDMSNRRDPVDGYSFRHAGEWASAHRDGLHRALLKLHERGQHTITLRGIRYLRRLAEDPVRPPQPLADAGGFPIERGKSATYQDHQA